MPIVVLAMCSPCIIPCITPCLRPFLTGNFPVCSSLLVIVCKKERIGNVLTGPTLSCSQSLSSYTSIAKMILTLSPWTHQLVVECLVDSSVVVPRRHRPRRLLKRLHLRPLPQRLLLLHLQRYGIS